MSSSEEIPLAATYILHILNSGNAIVAYDINKNQSILPKGDYYCQLTTNPNNPEVEAYQILKTSPGLYVNVSHLNHMGSQYFRISDLNSGLTMPE